MSVKQICANVYQPLLQQKVKWMRYLCCFMIFPFQAFANVQPVITSNPENKVNEDNPYVYEIVAEDIDGDTLSYSVPVLPGFLTFNSSTRKISGTPTNLDVGSHNVRIVVSDGLAQAEQLFSLEVINANDTPVLTKNIQNQTLIEDEVFVLDLAGTFSDEDVGDIITYTAENLPSGLRISTKGEITGAANNSDAQQVTFTVKIIATDQSKASSSTTFQIVVINVNDAPEPFDDYVVVSEDSSTIVDILKNDRDIDNDLLPSTVFITNSPLHGSYSIDTSTGLLSYMPVADFAGSDTLQYRISDPDGLVGTATVYFDVQNVNDAPVAQNDVVSTQEDTVVDIDVLANDSDIDEGDAPQGSQIIITSNPVNGSVIVLSGKIQYLPSANYTGTDGFSYKVADSNGAFSNTATVSITVAAVNDIPVAGDDVAATLEDTPVTFAVINNDSDTEDGSVNIGSMVIVNAPTHGSASINSDGTITYTPNRDYNGKDSLQYTITDSIGLTSNAATVSITINPVNDSPIANSDSVSLNEDTSIEINLLGNDLDVDGRDTINAASIEFTTTPVHGSLFLNTTSGIVKYTPEADYFGSDGFSYTFADTSGAVSNVALASLTVVAVNDPPRLNNDSATTDEDISVTIDVLANDSDVDGTLDISTLSFTQQPVSGTITTNSSGKVIYTPNLNFHGNDQFSYNIADNQGVESTKEATVLLTINSINDAPEALSEAATTFEDKSIEITLKGTDVDEDNLQFIVLQQPSHGTLSTVGATRTYTPSQDYNGSDSFTFKSNDGQLDSHTATISLTVISVNDRPIATSQVASVNEDSSIEIILTGTDIDGDSLTFRLAGGELSGNVTGSPPLITYTPGKNFNGPESLLFIANDGDLDSASGTVTIEVIAVNDAPTAEDQHFYLAEDNKVVFTLEANDIDGDSLDYSITSAPEHGELSGVAPNLTYTPNPNYAGGDQFVFKVNDGSEDSNAATVTLEISPTADAPIATAQLVRGDEDSPIEITLTGEDPDGNSLTYQLVSIPSRGKLEGTAPNLVYRGNQDYNGEDSFTFKVSDGNFESTAAKVKITVNPVNDPPKAQNDMYTRSMSGTTWLMLDVLANDTDIDGDTLQLVSAQADFGTLAIINNQLRFVPEAGFVGDVQLSYLMTDPAGERDHAIARLKIIDNSTPDDPLITPANDISVIATGRLTKVNLGAATALDKSGNIIPVELLNGRSSFPPGSHTVFWKATDSAGHNAIASQKVNVFPLVSLNHGQIIEEGGKGVVKVKLNGPAPNYPVVVPFTVAGNATSGIDYELSAGQIRINQGIETEITFDTIRDNIAEAPEQLIIKLGDTPYKSQESVYTATIVETNAAPKVSLFANQNGENRLLIERSTDLVRLVATIEDPTPLDSHSITWLPDSAISRSNDENEADFEFSPVNLSSGIYHVSAKISDDASPANMVEAEIFIQLVDSLANLGDGDSDGDLTNDISEGHGDGDGDHIADYLDPNSDCVVLPEQHHNYQKYLLEGQSNGCLRIGAFASQLASGGILIEDRGSLIGDDPDAQNTGGLFDFVIHNLNQNADQNAKNYAVVIPQRQPVPQDAVYRKYNENNGWSTFVEDSDNTIWSAAGAPGICPPPKANNWVRGLSVGAWCVQLILSDGGPNDADGIANGSISDLGGVAVYNSGNHFPVAVADIAEMTWNGTVEFDVLANDSDQDNDDLLLISVDAQYGNAVIVDGSKIAFTPVNNYVGQDSVNYTISDGHGGIASSSLAITVNGNSAPKANNDNAGTTNDKSIVIDVLGNDSDKDGDPLSISSANTDVGIVSITDDQKLRYTPKVGFVGIATVSYSVHDNKGAVDEAKLYISVTAPNVTSTPDTSSNNSGGGTFTGWLLIFALVGWRKHRMG